MQTLIECPQCKQVGRQTMMTIEMLNETEYKGHCPQCGEVFGFLVAASGNEVGEFVS
jgi:uncharacterized C2H2 Zn-finger protein